MGGGKYNCGEEQEGALLVLCLNMRVYNSVHLFLGWPQYTHSAGVLRNTRVWLHRRLEVTCCTYMTGYFHVYPFGQILVTICMNCFSCTWTLCLSVIFTCT